MWRSVDEMGTFHSQSVSCASSNHDAHRRPLGNLDLPPGPLPDRSSTACFYCRCRFRDSPPLLELFPLVPRASSHLRM